ncbi:Pyruvate/2-oxoglutarate dehydrogenase complex, dihydrolipoamide dehydrogenase (E3) component [Dyella sp. OK004]|uniref:NAD(P)/FAD-dependent oxidoreductase n=1 Tax=Dyella sp. OK004 TaxID=1855292 RepID=UPI0008E30E62|nr:FAD/NAD(P)-binding oxidoreductase [Dyella sp. OK004]SFS18736.1 Pyruvate/2-oxoglutarate dehydrogenase complex, dihydrolipoamide dehydrogenase (E3) component [Dyella sp. OK004]
MTERYDVLIVGAGPAGLAAAQTAASRGARVGLIDAQARAGGQVWRHDVRRTAPRAAREAIAALRSVELLTNHQVVAAEPSALRVETQQGSSLLSYTSLILATGARELLLPFPGWTLPGVTGAGGMQALVKQGWPIAGKRVVIAGSGPLLLAAAATLRAHGARLQGIYEQAPVARVHAFARQLLRWPARATQAVALRAQLAGVPYRFGTFVRSAHGEAALRTVDIEGPHGTTRLDCDLLAVGYGLVPNVELAQLLGCATVQRSAHPQVQVDPSLRTSVAGIYAAGEANGIGGLAVARLEGAIAGHMAVGDTAAANLLLPRRDKARGFAELLATHFSLDPRLHQLADAQTLICRCEDVTLGELDGFSDARAAKLATRCGMGACQGRICGTVLAELGRFSRSGSRPPLFPARLATLAGAATFPLPTISTEVADHE